MREIEFRACKDCKYYNKNDAVCSRINDYMDYYICLDDNETEYIIIKSDLDYFVEAKLKVDKNFGYNKFERRDDEN